ncbi:MAG: hypothetical protein M3164_05455, partial [Actinomycetota bacterium]|nr:hypothetical protein [Actinomycetota bacterium]
MKLRQAVAAFLTVMLSACGPAGDDGGERQPNEPRDESQPKTPSREGLEWRRHPSAPTPRTEVAAAALAGRIYVIGGFAEDGSTVPTVEIYDPQQDRFSRGPDLPLAVNHAMAASHGDTLYVFGGYREGLSAPTDRAFALRAGRWEEIP